MAGPVAVRGQFELLGDLLDAAADQIGDCEAYVDGDRRLTFAQWARAADGVATSFACAGVGPGDVVALRIGNGIEYAVSCAAAVRLGAVVTGINPRLGPVEVDSILARCSPALVVDDAAVIAAASDGPPLSVRPDCSPMDPVCIIWTSGTTGLPKGAWFDHRNQAAAVAAAGAMTMAHDRRLVGLPFAHAGYMAKLWEQLAMGVTLVLAPEPWSAESMLELLGYERITACGAVPTQWSKLLEVPGIADVDVSELRIGLSATAPAPPELIERVAGTLGCPLVVRYAMTESPSITGTEPDDPPEVQYRTVGRPQAGMAVAIVGDDGEPLPAGQVGRVRVQGACVMRGYWADPEQTEAAFDAHRRFLSGDLGSIDPDGNLVLAGRADDLYIRGGYNVYPIEVENVLAAHPAVDRVAVVGVEAPVIGAIGVAVVVPPDGAAAPTLEELRDWVRERLADYKAPDQLEIVDELPLTAMMKIDKSALAARLSDGGSR